MHRRIVLLLVAAVLTLPQTKTSVLEPGRLYRVDVDRWPSEEQSWRLEHAGQVLIEKRLSPFDPTASIYFRATSSQAPVSNLPFRLTVVEDRAAVASSDSPDRPVDLDLDRTYHALNARQPYWEAPPAEGQHWYRVHNRGKEPRVLFASILVEDRDLPSDIETFTREANGSLVLYREGEFSYQPEATQTLPGFASFRTRLLHPGQQLWLRVTANHPAYSLRLQTYAAKEARTAPDAVRQGMDFLASLGASWHANVPRRGAVVTRQTLAHPEVQGCVACHPTLFTLRAYDQARANGYPEANTAATSVLRDQLRNNPRPFPGLPGVTWARTIFSVRAVSARMANYVPGAIQFLHHTDRASDAEEADGAPPNVSPFEIAYEGWRATKLITFAERLQSLPVRNVVDLNWKLTAYAAMHLPTAKLAEELLSWQRPDGLFPYHFDRAEPGAEFITWHALYALARAGLTLEDARIARLARLCLARQTTSGAWQGDPAHKAFDTPFRDTQFAVMALSTLYPQKPTPAPAIPTPSTPTPATPTPDELPAATSSPSELRATLRSLYRNARLAADRELVHPGSILALLKAGATSPHPLLRFESARSTARLFPLLVDSPSAEPLLTLITSGIYREADERVRMGWQQAIYGALDENEGYLETWIQQLASTDEQALARAAIERRRQTLQRHLARALSAAPSSAQVHLLNALWDHPQRHAGLPSDWRKRTEIVLPPYFAEYQHGIQSLSSNYEPYRQNAGFRYSSDNPFFKTRLGNDSDLPDLGQPVPELEAALLRALSSPDPQLAISAIKALSLFPQGTTPGLTQAATALLASPHAPVVRYVFENDACGSLTLTASPGAESTLVDTLLDVLDAQHPDALATLLPALAKLTPGEGITRNPNLQGRLERLLLHPQGVPLEKAIAAAAAFPHIADGPLMRTTMLEAFSSGDRQLESAAVEIFIRSYIAEPTNPVLARQFAEKSQANVRRMMIDGLDPTRFSLRLSALNRYNPGRDVVLPEDANLFSSDVAQHLVHLGLEDKDPAIQRAAAELVSRYPELSRFRPLANLPPLPPPSLEVFARDIQPLLVQPGADGRACAMCHATQGKFPLRLPAKTGFTSAQTQFNYESILRELNLADPKSSLLLIKPTRPNDNAGDPALHTSTHGGGTRWGRNTLEATASPEYEKILRWIRGAQ